MSLNFVAFPHIRCRLVYHAGVILQAESDELVRLPVGFVVFKNNTIETKQYRARGKV